MNNKMITTRKRGKAWWSIFLIMKNGIEDRLCAAREISFVDVDVLLKDKSFSIE